MTSPLLECALKASILIAIAALVALAAKRAAASARHMIWLASLAAALALPLVMPFAPRTFIRILPAFDSASGQVVGPVTGGVPADRVVTIEQATARAQESPDEASEVNPLLVIWLLGAIFVVSRYAIGVARLRKLVTRNAEPAPPEIEREAQRLGLPRKGRVYLSPAAGAMTWGLRRPIVLLPDDADLWTPERREAVLRHETAHVRRHDFASQLLAELACALYWFNPIVWLGARAMRAEAESAADDSVLRSGMKPSAYAAELLQLAAELSRRPPILARVGIPIMTQPKIENRLKSVLAPAARRRGITRPQLLAAALAFAVAAPVLAGLHAAPVTSGPRSPAETKEALDRLKMAALATLMYSQDYDDYLPNGKTTADVVKQLMPYAKRTDIFQSPAPGGSFEFSLKLRHVNLSSPPSPAEEILWREKLRDSTQAYGVAFIDGHVKLIHPKVPPR